MEISELIHQQSPWLRDQGFVPREFFLPKRHSFMPLYQDVVDLKQIISVTGLRRIGKSTLLKQIIAQLLKNGVKPKDIIYFSFDQPTVLEELDTLGEIIEFFLKKVQSTPLHRLNHPIYIFLDEIQLIPFWQDIIKRYYDINQHLKFIVSGSSTLFIERKSKESLAGRIFERSLPPLTFAEYKAISGRADFIEYLDFGQFPELLEITDTTRRIDYLKEGVIGKILEVDIIKTYGVRKTIDFERLFWSLLPNTGQIIQSRKLMADLSLKKATLFKYLTILEKSLLIHKVLNASGSFRSEARLMRKLYPASTNFLSLTADTVDIGRKVECYVATILQQHVKPVYLYHHRGKEIDFVLPEQKLAIEVKYQSKIHANDWRFLEAYCTKKNYRGIVITKNKEKNPQVKNLSLISLEMLEEFAQNQLRG